jgi:hypothetical protein
MNVIIEKNSGFGYFDNINADQVSMLLNFFPSSMMMRPNKLKGLSLETLSSQILKFEDKSRANPIGVPFRCFLLGLTPGATSKC